MEDIKSPENTDSYESLDKSKEKPFSGFEQQLETKIEKNKEPAQKKTDDEEISLPGDEEKKESVLDKDPVVSEVENILSEDLDEIYSGLSSKVQAEFKQKGEETAGQIANMLNQVKFKFSEILELIKNWLKIIPGVSKFFLEQEAKIKTDKLVKYNQNKQNKN